MAQNEISSFDHSSAHKPKDKDYYDTAKEFDQPSADKQQEETHPPMALKTRDGKEIQLPEYLVGPREPRRKKQGISKGIRYKKKMPIIRGKNAFLRYVQAHDCIKDKIMGCYRVEPKNIKKPKNEKNDNGEPVLTKLERKQKYKELKQTLQREWSTEMESDESDKDFLSAPSHFKRYTI